jgi:hypothetical protein
MEDNRVFRCHCRKRSKDQLNFEQIEWRCSVVELFLLSVDYRETTKTIPASIWDWYFYQPADLENCMWDTAHVSSIVVCFRRRV